MPEMTSTQRKYLRGMAHHVEPLVLVGKHGVSDMLVRAVADALESHELVKVRFNDFKEDKKEGAADIARRTGAEIVGMIGHVAIFFKWQTDDEKRKINLPK